ncbi:carboxypeptidase N subunit 2-like isoform X2 [Syngnathoides biaculeatus]|uniref:carboxypeptidase N subunit 2-like isoform X2 n=1 Tax=Syngnathoides biaculeatus TaxID=300417 RepID=UPI002ADDCBD4|nr:carboxypeptidase N subunit 2-like isoform X2 [Syngnathoides biaculeatus]
MLYTVLLFPKNQFSSLYWESFQIFTKLHKLDLNSNQVSQVTPSAGPLLPHLKVLGLRRNRITSLADGAFSACPALTNLYLNNNLIELLSDHTFAGLSKLEILDLSNNRIRVLPPLLLRPLHAIETLYLERNQISELPEDWFSPKEDVPYLYLFANPWACFCNLMYLHTYLQAYFFNFYMYDGQTFNASKTSLVCHSPQRLKDRAIFHLNQGDLCPPTQPPQTAATLLRLNSTSSVTDVQEESADIGQWITSGTLDQYGTTTTASHPTTSTPIPATISVGTPAGAEVAEVRDERYDASLPHMSCANVLCLWLLATNVCVCLLMVASTLLTLVRLRVWYRRASYMETQRLEKRDSRKIIVGGVPQGKQSRFFFIGT